MGSKRDVVKLVDSESPSLDGMVRWRVAVGGSAIIGNEEGKVGRVADEWILHAVSERDERVGVAWTWSRPLPGPTAPNWAAISRAHAVRR